MNRIARWRWPIVVVLVVVFGLGGYFLFRYFEERHLNVIENELASIAHLKTDWLATWKEEKFRDAMLIADEFERYLGASDGASTDPLPPIMRERLEAIRRFHAQEEILIYDLQGRSWFPAVTDTASQDPVRREMLATVLETGEPGMTKLHRDRPGGRAHLSFLVPLFAGVEKNPGLVPAMVAVLAVVHDADDFLFPVMRVSATSARSSESLLVSRDGDRVRFLTPLLYDPSGPLALWREVDDPHLPAARVIEGARGLVRGRDYRGEPVIAYVLPVPGTHWFLITKVDEAEAFGSERTRLLGWTVASASGVGLLTLAVFLGFERREREVLVDQLARERAWRDRELRYRMILRSIGDAVITFDTKGRVTSMNSASEKLSGWREEEASGMPWREVLPVRSAGSGEYLNLSMTEASSRGHGERMPDDFELIARDGTVRAIDVNGATIYTEEGAQAGAVLVFRDITRQRQVARENEYTRRMQSIGVLAGGVAHDFNNLLQSIMLNADMLRRRMGANAASSRMLSSIGADVAKAAKLCDRLLSYAGRRNVRVARLDLGRTLEENGNEFRSAVSEKVSLDMPRMPHGLIVEADESGIRQILTNLLENASESYRGGSGRVRLRLVEADFDEDESRVVPISAGKSLTAGRYAVIEVRDEGEGMDESTLGQLFSPFFSTRFTGRGLGLAEMAGILEGYGGSVQVRSRLGEGSCFRVFLPIARSDEDPAAELPARAV